MRLEFEILDSIGIPKQYNYLHIANLAYSLEIRTLIDTGAFFSVWTDGEDSFKRLFPAAKKLQGEQVPISGFGGAGGYQEVYCIPEFHLGDKYGNRLIYEGLPIVVTKREFSVKMILGYPLLSKLNFRHQAFDERGNAVSPRLIISSVRDRYKVGIARYIAGKAAGRIAYTYIYCQEERIGEPSGADEQAKERIASEGRVSYDKRVVRFTGRRDVNGEDIFSIVVGNREVRFVKRLTQMTADGRRIVKVGGKIYEGRKN